MILSTVVWPTDVKKSLHEHVRNRFIVLSVCLRAGRFLGKTGSYCFPHAARIVSVVCDLFRNKLALGKSNFAFDFLFIIPISSPGKRIIGSSCKLPPLVTSSHEFTYFRGNT